MKTQIYLGNYEVVEVTALFIKVHLGQGVTISIHPGDFPHTTKLGDKLPLYTELTRAKAKES